jgi:hypothetical protein
MTKLKDRLEEFKSAFESGGPPYNATLDAVATMHRATADLKASGIENTALKVGDRAPDFLLSNQDHVEVASKDLLRRTAGRQLLLRTLVTLLHDGAGGSTRD